MNDRLHRLARAYYDGGAEVSERLCPRCGSEADARACDCDGPSDEEAARSERGDDGGRDDG